MISSKAALATVAAMLAMGLGACDSSGPVAGKVPVAQEVTQPTQETFGNHIVHYSAISTTSLHEDVARAAGIGQRADRGMLIVAVLRQSNAAGNEPVTAVVEAQAVNLVGQISNISMTELRDGKSVSYVGEFSIAHGENMTFNISVLPEGSEAAHEFSFQKPFYNELN